MRKRVVIHKKTSVNLLSQEERLHAFAQSLELIHQSTISHSAFILANEYECVSGVPDGE